MIVPFHLMIGHFKRGFYFLPPIFYSPRQVRNQAFSGIEFQYSPEVVRNAVIEIPVYQSCLKIFADHNVPAKRFEIIIRIGDIVFVEVDDPDLSIIDDQVPKVIITVA